MDERARAQARYNISETCVDYVPLGELLALTGTDGVSLWEECCSRRLICGDIEGFLTYYRDQLSEAHHEYNSARRMVFEAYRTESDREVCDLYLQRINAELAEKGIKEVVVPEKLIERFSKEMSTKGNE